MSQVTTTTANGSGASESRFRSLILDASLADDEGGVNPLREALFEHFGTDPMNLAQTTEQEWNEVNQALVQTGIDLFVSQPGRSSEDIGFDAPVGDPRIQLTLSKMLCPSSLTWPGVTRGSATWARIRVGHSRFLRAITQGLILIHDDEAGPAAIWVNSHGLSYRNYSIMTTDAVRTQKVADEIRQLGRDNSPFIGEMFTVGMGERQYLERPTHIQRDDLILPPGILERIDQHAVGITQARTRLAGAGQHLKRGLLLYGPPGTGKTHTLRYLISQLPADTTIVVASPKTGSWNFERLPMMVGKSCMILIDDVDASAGDRSMGGDREALFTLLENMDGLQVKGDVLFVLTTNRLDVLEPAIAARPGRIDEVIEIPRPDDDCRRRLFDRYRKGLELDITDDELDQVIDKTKGVTGSFTKELLRRATVVAVERGAEPGEERLVKVTGADVFAAIDEMLDPANPATRLLLGADPEHALRQVNIQTEPAK